MGESGVGVYKGMLLPDDPSREDLKAIVSDYEVMLVEVMREIADRYDRSPDYPFVDTKLDLITGEDFRVDDPIRGRDAIYGWIQGRGLEALAGHCRWMKRHGFALDLLPRLERMMGEVLESLEVMRGKNEGRLSFFMTPDGEPFELDLDSRPRSIELGGESDYGFSDLFSAKGMYSAAHYLGDGAQISKALAYCHDVDKAIWQGRFTSDQISLDPKNPDERRPGYIPHGPFMIHLGTAALMTENGVVDGVEFGFRLVNYELDHHINIGGRVKDLEVNDFWEGIDENGHPFDDDGVVLSDPGHALECVGLILKFTRAARSVATEEQLMEIQALEQHLPGVLTHMFEVGFHAEPGGICKAYDLVARKPLNSDVPWWNLPETMRTAAFCAEIAKTGDAQMDAYRILGQCHNAFTRGFVRPDLHLMAYQTLSESGEVIPVIPATADADPGYHTGLSIIDMLEVLGGG
jgi:hypothetical protein